MSAQGLPRAPTAASASTDEPSSSGASASPGAPAAARGPDPRRAHERLLLDAVEQALDWPVEERAARLTEFYGADAAVLAQIRDLLGIAEGGQRSLPTMLPIARAIGAEPPPPERLGPYRLGALLGRGGMGRVFRAARADGVFDQQVAIKLMSHGFASAQLAEQFARERQILADLQHPNIARLLDGGVGPLGQSYIVMELLLGQPITAYVADRGLGARQLLALFMPVCAAVAHAHARLVVHADIKPSNVIVTESGEVKLLDFGVARVLAATTAATPNDVTAPLGLTQDYASPARRHGAPATTIDDVYALGVLLEELLAPCADAPPDLHAIAARARAEELEQRYPTVDALRDDLQRWLDGLAVQAFDGGWRYRAGKLLTRHRLATAIGALALLLLAGAAVALTVLYLRAESARHQAEQRFADLRELSSFVLFDVYDRLGQVPRALPLRRDLAERAQQYLDRLAADPAAPPALRLEVVEGLRRLAQVQATPGDASLGEHAKARANLARAAALAEALPATPALERERGLTAIRLALLQATIAHSIELDFDAANEALARARARLDAFGALGASSSRDADVLALERDWAVEQAAVLQWTGDHRRSQQIARAALATFTAAAASTPPADRTTALQRARLLDILAESLFYDGAVAAAEAPYREQLAILEATAAAHPDDVSIERRVARAGWALGSTLLDLGRPTEAEPLLARAESRYERLRLLEPDDRELARSLDITASARAQALVQLRRFAEAETMLRRSVDFRAAHLAADPRNASAHRDLAIARAALGDALAERGERRSACAVYAQAARDFELIRASGRLSNLDRDYGLRRLLERQARHCSP